MNDKYVLDACALIAFLGNEAGADIVEELLVRSKRKEIELFINTINLLEIYYGVFHAAGKEKAEEVLHTIKELPLEIVNKISKNVFLEAGGLKAQNSISLADSIAVAEANVRNAKFVTADHHEIDKLEEEKIVKVHWIR